MGAGHNVTVLYELVPANKYRKANYIGYLRLRYKPNTGGPSKKKSYPVAANHHTDASASNDIRWAAAVAEFSMLLTDSKHKGAATWKHCLEMANNAIGKDTEGYRAEMLGLIGKAQAVANAKKKIAFGGLKYKRGRCGASSPFVFVIIGAIPRNT